MLSKMLWQAMQQQPAKTAIAQGNRRMSYEQLYCSAYTCRLGLQHKGITSNDCVAVILPNCPEFVVSFFACAHLGAIMLPLNPNYTREELQRFLVDGQAKIILTDAARWDICQQIVTEIDTSIQLILLEDSNRTDLTPKEHTFAHLINTETPAIDLSATPTTTLTDQPVLYLYTSGSTSEYKRLCCTQENLYYEAHNFVETIKLTADDAILCTVPLYHSYGFGNGLLDAVYTASTLVLLEPVIENGQVIDAPFISRSQRVLELIQQENIAFFPGVPYQFAALAALPDEALIDLSGLKWCISSGDVLPQATYERFLKRFGIAIRSLYGSTEAGSICINTDSTETVTFGSLGVPLHNVTIEIRNDEGHTLACNESGTIWVKSPVIPPTGYDNRPELSLEAFKAGYYDTGDLGKLNARGHLILTGRKQTFVDIGGYKVDISEVEEVLTNYPNVREAAVLGIAMHADSQVIKAVLVLHDSSDTAQEETNIIQYCRACLASYKIPRLIEFRAELPRSPLGKILKKQLQTSSIVENVPPLASLLQDLPNPTKEQQLALIAQQIQQQMAITLQVEVTQISYTDSFQSLGFDSIRSAELQNRLIQLTGLALSITLLWNYPSINELSHVLRDKLLLSHAIDETDGSLSSQSTATISTDQSNFAQLVQQIDALSNETVDEFFNQRFPPLN